MREDRMNIGDSPFSLPLTASTLVSRLGRISAPEQTPKTPDGSLNVLRLSVAIIRAALSISSQKHLGQAPEGDGADQGY